MSEHLDSIPWWSQNDTFLSENINIKNSEKTNDNIDTTKKDKEENKK